ncbi:MAG: AMP-binding protein [Pseudomonadota bacterium]|nr:AMP-binding protein [Pseudomonadota bacterium]
MTEAHALHAPCTMGDLLLRALARGGDAAAFVERRPDATRGDRTASYAETAARLSRLIQALEARGFARGDVIACLGANSLDSWLVIAAGWLMGIRTTNLHPMGSAEDHAFIIRDCGAKALVYDPARHADRGRAMIAQGVPALALGPSADAPDIVAEAAEREARPLVSAARAADPAWTVYTGGTTGKPKGVLHTHRSLVTMTLTELAEWEWPARIVFLACTPISHASGPCILPTLLRGGTVVLEDGFAPDRFFDTVRAHGVTATFLVPTMIYKLLDHAAAHPVGRTPLETVIYGGAPIAPARLTEALAAFGPVFMQLYGQSEAPNTISVLRKADHDPVRLPGRMTSCGQPVGDSRVALLDPEGREVAAGEIGEICVQGPLVMEEYLGRPDETAKAFAHGWLHTGDLARADADGFLHIVGRAKDMIITGGFNIYPAEVEDALTAHPAVAAAAVIGLPHATWGEAVTAVVVLRPGAQATAEELTALVRQAKGPVAAPKRVDFAESLPVTSLGKPDKKALRDAYAAAGLEATA